MADRFASRRLPPQRRLAVCFHRVRNLNGRRGTARRQGGIRGHARSRRRRRRWLARRRINNRRTHLRPGSLTRRHVLVARLSAPRLPPHKRNAVRIHLTARMAGRGGREVRRCTSSGRCAGKGAPHSWRKLISLRAVHERTKTVHTRQLSDALTVARSRSDHRRCTLTDLPIRTLGRVRRWRCTVPDLLNVCHRRRIRRWWCSRSD